MSPRPSLGPMSMNRSFFTHEKVTGISSRIQDIIIRGYEET